MSSRDFTDLAIYLSGPGEIPSIGPEKGRGPLKNSIARYVSPYGSFRYVAYLKGQAVSALQVVRLGDPNERVGIIANVYTLPPHRRRNLATKLFDYAWRDFYTLKFSTHLSANGRFWKAHILRYYQKRLDVVVEE